MHKFLLLGAVVSAALILRHHAAASSSASPPPTITPAIPCPKPSDGTAAAAAAYRACIEAQFAQFFAAPPLLHNWNQQTGQQPSTGPKIY